MMMIMIMMRVDVASCQLPIANCLLQVGAMYDDIVIVLPVIGVYNCTDQ